MWSCRPESVAPSELYRFGELTIDDAERTISLAVHPVELTDTDHRLLFETFGQRRAGAGPRESAATSLGTAPSVTGFAEASCWAGERTQRNASRVASGVRYGYRRARGAERGQGS